MRIAIVSFFYRPVGGGVPRYIDTITQKFIEKGHRVDILTSAYGGDEKVEREGKKTVYRLPCMDVHGQTEDINKQKSKEFLKFLKKYVRKNPDIIVSQNMHAAVNSVGHTFALNIMAIEKEIPQVLTVHSFIQKDQVQKLKEALIKNLFWDKIISVGAHLAEDLFNLGVSSDKLTVIHPPVDTEKFNQNLGRKWLRTRVKVSEKEKLILHASRIDTEQTAKEKGVFTLLKAFAALKQKDVKLVFAHAPSAPNMVKIQEETISKLKQRAKLLGIENKVKFEQFDPEEMQFVYSGADLFVMASQMESFGLVYAEALACGIPVIGTAVGGVPEVIDDEITGELIQPDNHVELTKRIKRMLSNPEKMKAMGEAGREAIVERINIEKICNNLLGTYESAIKEKHKKKII